MTDPLGRRQTSDLGSGEAFTVYVTKYALAEAGILTGEGHLLGGTPARVVVQGKTHKLFFEGEGDEWHRTLESARERLRTMTEARIVLLSKQLKDTRLALAGAKKATARPIA